MRVQRALREGYADAAEGFAVGVRTVEAPAPLVETPFFALARSRAMKVHPRLLLCGERLDEQRISQRHLNPVQLQ